MKRRRHAPPFVPMRLGFARAQWRWEVLADTAALDDACDPRLCAKLAKARKQAWRSERRFVRRLLKGAVA